MNNKIGNVTAQVLSVFSMAAGAFGMLFCFFFLWSTKLEDILASGLPFIAASVLFGSGLIGFSLLNKSK